MTGYTETGRVFHEVYGHVTPEQLATCLKRNVSQSDHDQLADAFGDSPSAIVTFIEANLVGGSYNAPWPFTGYGCGWQPNDEVTTTAGSIWATQEQAYAAGQASERERLVKMLEGYFALTQEPADEPAPENAEWDRGFQAAMALIRNPYNRGGDK